MRHLVGVAWFVLVMWMFYTNRRANVAGLPGVSWVHETRIGMAESADGGATWKYRGTAELSVGGSEDTHWAPDIVSGDRAYLFYFTHPGRRPDAPKTDTEQRRSSIQVVELKYDDGQLTCDRNQPTHIRLMPPNRQ